MPIAGRKQRFLRPGLANPVFRGSFGAISLAPVLQNNHAS